MPEDDGPPLNLAVSSLLDDLPDGYFELDLAGRLIRSNRAFSELSGYAPEQVKGFRYRRWIDADTGRLLRRACKQVYRTGAPVRNINFAFVHADGNLRSGEISIALKGDPAQPPHEFLGLLRDCSEHKRSELGFRGERDLLRSVIDLLPEQI